MKGSTDTTCNNSVVKERTIRKISITDVIKESIEIITQDMSDHCGISSVTFLDNIERAVILECGDKSWYIITNKDAFWENIKGDERIAWNHYRCNNINKFLINLEGNEKQKLFLERYVGECRKNRKKLKNTFPTKGMLLKYFEHLNAEYNIFLKNKSHNQIEGTNNQSVIIAKGSISIFEDKVTSFQDFIEKIGERIMDVLKQYNANTTLTFHDHHITNDDKYIEYDGEPYVKLEYGNNTEFFVISDSTNNLPHLQYKECTLCIEHKNYMCTEDNKNLKFYSCEFEDSKERAFAKKYMRSMIDKGVQYKGNTLELSKNFYNSSSQFWCQHVQNELTTITSDTTTALYDASYLTTTGIPSSSIIALGLISTVCTGFAPALKQRIDSYDNNEITINDYLLPILVSVGSAITAAAFGIAYFICRRNQNRRNLSVRNRRGLEALEEGNGQQQLEEGEHLPMQGEQQLNSENNVERNQLSPVTNNEVSASSPLSSNSNTLSRTGSSSSSRSGTVSRTRSLSSTGEGSQTNSDLEEVVPEDSQRSPSLANVTQPSTSMERVQSIGNRSSRPIPAVRKVLGCLGDSCY